MRAADWDTRYREAGSSPFGDMPNAYLRMALALPECQPKTALMLADGDGRNGTWLAGQGISVTAVDLSAEATQLAERRDEAARVSVNRINADLSEWSVPDQRQFDLVTLVYMHGPEAIRSSVIALGLSAVAPGGWFLLEGFAASDVLEGPGPSDPSLRYDINAVQLPEDFQVIEQLSGQVRLDEGSRHQGLAQIARLLVRRMT